jgi:arginine deiminase
MSPPKDAAHGGPGWLPRSSTLLEEIGEIWRDCGISNEWSPLKAVLVHKPGEEIKSVTNANQALMHSIPDFSLAREQHDNMVSAYQNVGIDILYVNPFGVPTPNLMFVADLFFMTPEGAILGRPASTARAGEERHIAMRLAELNIPILRSIRGIGVFEGADASWINSGTVIVGVGLRTNSEGASQVASILREIGVETINVRLPGDAMHLMGALRFVNRDQVIVWRNRISEEAVTALSEHGFSIAFIPDEGEAVKGMALNFVTLAPNKILMPSGNPKTQLFYESMGLECKSVDVTELHKAAGGIGCMTGIIHRD